MRSRVYETVRCPSVCAGLLLWARRAEDVDRSLKQWRAAGSATLPAYVCSWIHRGLVFTSSRAAVQFRSRLQFSLMFSFREASPGGCVYATKWLLWCDELLSSRASSAWTSSSSSSRLQDAADRDERRRLILPHSAASWCRHRPYANHHNLREWGKMPPDRHVVKATSTS